MTLRLRQICLVAPRLAPVVDAIEAIFGLPVCHRDPAVAAYGLENVLFVCGHQFLEVVAPTRDGTAAGRYLQRSGGRGGYIAIFDTHDPERRCAHVQALGIRIAHVMEHPAFFGIQLHPADCRATMLEFDRSQGNERLDGAYWPAGSHWLDAQRLDRVSGIRCIDVVSPEPDALAAHWARIVDSSLARDAHGAPLLRFDLGSARFVRALDGQAERLDAVHIDVDDAARVQAAALRAGCSADAAYGERGFRLAGVRFVPHAHELSRVAAR